MNHRPLRLPFHHMIPPETADGPVSQHKVHAVPQQCADALQHSLCRVPVWWTWNSDSAICVLPSILQGAAPGSTATMRTGVQQTTAMRSCTTSANCAKSQLFGQWVCSRQIGSRRRLHRGTEDVGHLASSWPPGLMLWQPRPVRVCFSWVKGIGDCVAPVCFDEQL
jgi:hypothetical protein